MSHIALLDRTTMPEISAEQFFDQELPRLLEEGSARSQRQADVVFEVGGMGGGRWRLHLAKQPSIEPVDQTVKGDLLVRMSEREFPEFIEGTLDVVRAVEEGRLLLAGDLSILDELAGMWSTPMSMVALRVRESDS